VDSEGDGDGLLGSPANRPLLPQPVRVVPRKRSHAVFYCNDKEVGRWEDPRVSTVPSAFIIEMTTGGWDNNAVDDKHLPANYLIDYVRVWQRKDPASGSGGRNEWTLHPRGLAVARRRRTRGTKFTISPTNDELAADLEQHGGGQGIGYRRLLGRQGIPCHVMGPQRNRLPLTSRHLTPSRAGGIIAFGV